MGLYNYDNISWNLPVMFCHDAVIFAIGDVIKEFKDIPRPKLFAYGSITSPWAGGRDTNTKFFDTKFIERHLNRIIDAGFIPTFTFTKPHVKKENLDDKMSNWILDFGVEHNCEFLVSSDNLYNHIRERHPDAKLAASILQGKMTFHGQNNKARREDDYELNFYNERIDKYERVVIRPEYAIKNLEKDIDRIKDVSKLEVHINETCLPNCPYAIRCYSSMDSTLLSDNAKQGKCGRAEFDKNSSKKNAYSYSVMLKKDLIDRLVYKHGIKHLKIQGRHYPFIYLANLVLYHVFDMTGNFQSIYPYVIQKLLEYSDNGYCLPPEEYIVGEQMFRALFMDLW